MKIINFCAFNDDGRIRYTGSVPESMLIHQEEGVILIPEGVKANTHYINLNDLTAYPLGDSPSKFHKFDYLTHEWIDSRTLEQFKDLKWEEIKAKRTEVELGPFEYNNMMFDGNLDAQRRLSVLISISKTALAQGSDLTFNFTLFDNTSTELHAMDFVNIELAKAMAVDAAFDKARLKRIEIYSRNTKEEIDAIAW